MDFFSFPVNLAKWFINWWPPLIFTGIKLVHISADARKLHVEMPLRFYNKNVLGIHFGGSLYTMTDPWYLMMLSRNLGNGYLVIDQSATINYLQPGKSRVTADFLLTQEHIDNIIMQTESGEKHLESFQIEIKDQNNVIICIVNKTLYIRKKPSH